MGNLNLGDKQQLEYIANIAAEREHDNGHLDEPGPWFGYGHRDINCCLVCVHKQVNHH